MSDPFSPIDSMPRGGPETPKFRVIMPVPADAPLPPEKHPKLGKPSARWVYLDKGGALLGFAYRFDKRDGKQFRPLALFEPAAGGRPEWRWEAWPIPRPLYGLDRLAARPQAPVLLCEGEKAAAAATKLLPDHVAIASPNGAKAASKADWSPLAGRRLIIWPDADAPGVAYAREAGELAVIAGAASVSILAPPKDAADGWDAADALAEGFSPEALRQMIEAAEPLEIAAAREAGLDKKGKGNKRPRAANLMGLAQYCTFWRGPDYEAYVRIPVGEHEENWQVSSATFKRWLAIRTYEASGIVPGAQKIEDTIRVLTARAISEGREQTPWRRVGARDGKLYIDLADADWRVIEIAVDGWRVLDRHDLPFLRSPRSQPLCEPEAGSSIDELRRFANVETEEDFVVVVAWVVGALRERGPYPILVINGEQGSGKSKFSRLLRSLIDPGCPAIQGPPQDEQNIILTAQNAHLVALDNISRIDPILSDSLCRLATGSGFAVRKKYTDAEESLFEGARPIILNGIPSFIDRADLNERAQVIHLASISEEARRPEDEIEADWKLVRPRVLGALCDALSSGLKRIDSVRLTRFGRMADFEKWMTAAELGLGWEPGTFAAAYEKGRRASEDIAFEADIVAVAIEGFILKEDATFWRGTPTTLLSLLNREASEVIRQTHAWPKTAQGLGNCIARATPLLRRRGIIVERRHSGARIITITRGGGA